MWLQIPLSFLPFLSEHVPTYLISLLNVAARCELMNSNYDLRIQCSPAVSFLSLPAFLAPSSKNRGEEKTFLDTHLPFPA